MPLPSAFDGAVKNPDGSVYYPNGNFTVLPNGILLSGKPSPGDVQRFGKIPRGGGENNSGMLEGAVKYPTGGVYLPKSDLFVLPNGWMVGNNGSGADGLVKSALKFPKVKQPGEGRKSPFKPPVDEKFGGPPPVRKPFKPIPPRPTDPDRPRPPIGEPVPGFPPGIGPTPPITPKPPITPTPLPPFDNFDKGQARNERMPGDVYRPFFESFYGSNDGYDPYNGAGGRAAVGRPTMYDPLGIGEMAYDDPNASYYGMEGVNSVLGEQNAGPMRYGLVGGQGGYGMGMVGRDYTGPIFDDTRGVMKAMRRQRRALGRTQRANAVGPELDKFGQPIPPVAPPVAPVAPKKPKPGQPPATPTTPPVTPPAVAPPVTPPVAGQPQGFAGLETTGQLPALAQGGQFRANVDGRDLDLVQDSGGNSSIYKANGQDNGRRYHFDPRVGKWKSMTTEEYRGYGETQYYNIADSPEWRDKAGQVYQTTTRVGDGQRSTSGTRQGSAFKPIQYNTTPKWTP